MNTGYGGTVSLGANTLTVYASSFTYTAGTWDGGTGKVIIQCTNGANAAITADGLSFYNLSFKKNGGNTQTITVSGTLTVTNNVAFSNTVTTSSWKFSVNGGTINAEGNISIDTDNGNVNGGSTKIALTGTGTQTITGDGSSSYGDRFPHLEINKPSGTASLANSAAVNQFTFTQGTFELNSYTFSVYPGNFTYTAGTFTAGTSTVKFNVTNGTSQSVSADGLSFYNLTFTKGGGNTQTISVSGTLTVTNDLAFSNSYTTSTNARLLVSGGTLNVEGNLSIDTSNGNINGGTTKINLTGTGTQTMTSVSSSTGDRFTPMEVNKPSGAATLASNVAAGTFTLTQGEIDLVSYTLTVASSTFTQNGGTVNTNSGILNISNSDFAYTAGTISGTGTVQLVTTTADPSFSANGASFYNLTIKRNNSGDNVETVTVSGTCTVTNDLTLTNVDMSAGGSDNLTINGGTINVEGNVILNETIEDNDLSGGTTTIALTGTGAQSITPTGATPLMPRLEINKPSGSLTLTNSITCSGFTLTQGEIDLASYTLTVYNGDFTYTAGTFTAGTGTLSLYTYSTDPAFSANGLSFYNLTFKRNGSDTVETVTVSGTCTVTNDLTLTNNDTSAGGSDNLKLNGGTINVEGNIILNETIEDNDVDGGTTTIALTGTGAQSISVTANTPQLPHLKINKTSGTASLANNVRTNAFTLTQGEIDLVSYTLTVYNSDFTYTAGTFTAGTGTVLFHTYDADPTFSANGLSFYNLTFKRSSGDNTETITVSGTVTVTNDLTLTNTDNSGTSDNLTINSGTINVEGNIIINETNDNNDLTGGTTTITLTGTGAQSLTATGASPIMPHLKINKASGTASLASNLSTATFTHTQGVFDIGVYTFTISGGNFTYTAGTFTAGTNSKVVFNANSQKTMSADGLSFYNLTYKHTANNNTYTTSGTLTVTNDFTLDNTYMDLTCNGGTINVEGNVELTGAAENEIFGGTTNIILTGTGAQTLTGANGVFPKLTINKASGTASLASNIRIKTLVVTQGEIDLSSYVLQINTSGTFTQNGGIVTITTGELRFYDSSFSHTAGTFSTTTDSSIRWINQSTTRSCTANGVSFTNLTISRSAGSGDSTFTFSGTLTVTNELKFQNSEETVGDDLTINGGTINVEGNVIAAESNGNLTGGTTNVKLTGTGAQTLTATGSSPVLPKLTIDKASGTASLATNFWTSDFTLTQGEFDASDYALSINGSTSIDGGTFKTGTGVVTFGDAGGDSLTISGGTLEVESDATATDIVVNAGTKTNTGGTIDYQTVSTALRSALPYYDLTLSTSSSTYTLDGAVTVGGDLTINTGVTLDVSASNYALNVAGNWSNSGTFTARAGTVTLNGTNQTIAGATTFYALSKTTSSNCTLTLPAGVETTVQNSLTLQGASANLLYLLSSTPGTQTKLTLETGGSQDIQYVGPKDNDASDGLELVNTNGTDFGNNLNWTFPVVNDVLAGIIGWWKLNESSGTLADSSGNGYNATAYNGPVYGQTGAKDTCLDFDGSNDYLAISGLNYSSVGEISAMTVCAWIKIGTDKGDWSILDFDRSEYFNFATTTNGTVNGVGGGSVLFATADTGSTIHDQYTADDLVDDNEWHFVAATYDGTDKLIYVDAVLKSTASNAHGGLALGTGVTRYGFIGDGSEATAVNGDRNNIYFDGLIDDVRVYNRALSSGEISSVYSGSAWGTGTISLKDTSSSSTTATNDTTVTVDFATLEATVTQLELSNDNVSWTVVSGYSAGDATHSASWTLTSNDGDKIVHARITNDGTTYNKSDIIALDTAAPAAPTSLTLTPGSNNDEITAQVTAPADADISQIAWRYNALDGNVSATYPSTSTSGTAFGTGLSSSVTPSSAVQITASSLTQLKTYGVTAWAIDTAGNASASAAQNSLYLTPPTPRLVVTGPSSATSAQSGADTVITITAKDENGNVISAYAGPYSLTWTPTGGNATTLVNSSSSGFSSGVVSPTVSVGGATAGTGTLTAIDNSDNSLTSGTLAFTFYPASFTITPEATTQRAGNPFTVSITAKDAADATCTGYSGTVALTVTYVNPTTGTKSITPTTLTASNFTDGVASITSAKYSDCGIVKLKAQDTTYVTGVTVTGTSSNMTFTPYSFGVTTSTIPSSRTKFYEDEEFDVIVTAQDKQGNTTKNYRGTVSFTQTSNLGLPISNYKFIGRDLGVHTFTGVTGSSSGTYTIACKDTTTTTITGSTTVGVISGRIIIMNQSGSTGTLTGTLYINNESSNQIVTADNSCVITLSISESSSNGSASLTDSTVTVSGGEATFSITDTEGETVTVTATSSPSLPVTDGTFTFGANSNNRFRVHYWREVTHDMPTFDTRGFKLLTRPENLSFHTLGKNSQVMQDGVTGAHMPFHRAMMNEVASMMTLKRDMVNRDQNMQHLPTHMEQAPSDFMPSFAPEHESSIKPDLMPELELPEPIKEMMMLYNIKPPKDPKDFDQFIQDMYTMMENLDQGIVNPKPLGMTEGEETADYYTKMSDIVEQSTTSRNESKEGEGEGETKTEERNTEEQEEE